MFLTKHFQSICAPLPHVIPISSTIALRNASFRYNSASCALWEKCSHRQGGACNVLFKSQLSYERRHGHRKQWKTRWRMTPHRIVRRVPALSVTTSIVLAEKVLARYTRQRVQKKHVKHTRRVKPGKSQRHKVTQCTEPHQAISTDRSYRLQCFWGAIELVTSTCYLRSVHRFELQLPPPSIQYLAYSIPIAATRHPNFTYQVCMSRSHRRVCSSYVWAANMLVKGSPRIVTWTFCWGWHPPR